MTIYGHLRFQQKILRGKVNIGFKGIIYYYVIIIYQNLWISQGVNATKFKFREKLNRWKSRGVSLKNFFDLKSKLKMFLFSVLFSSILLQFPKKLHVLKSAKPSNALNMFLIFWPLKPYVLIQFVLIKKKRSKYDVAYIQIIFV